MKDGSESCKDVAIRRFHQRRRWLRRLLQRARELYPHPDFLYINMRTWSEVHEARRRYVQLHYRTRKTCSGWCCGNPRRHFRAMTAQEMRAALDAREQFEEVGLMYRRGRFRADCCVRSLTSDAPVARSARE